MLVDDSIVARAVLSRMIESDGGFAIVGVAASGEDAIAALDHVHVDIVLLDLEFERFEDVVEAIGEPTPVRAAMSAGWEGAALGMVETEMGPLLLVDVAALVGGQEQRAAA